MADDFDASVFGIQPSKVGHDVRLVFGNNDGAERAIVMDQRTLPGVLREIQSKISSPQVVPISAASLQIGARVVVGGHQVGPGVQGGKKLTLFVELVDEGRTVTLSLDLPPKVVKAFIADLSRP